MIFKTTSLRDAIAFALTVSATTLVGSGVALAQEADAPTPTTLDRVEVTGSRIRQVDLETSQPVQIISRQDIEQMGFQSVTDILRTVSATGTFDYSRGQPTGAGEFVGGQFVSLRNIGSQRTLVLVDGKRLGVSTQGFQDLSLIPTAMIERIEVLKDGASSIYGSDAIGGVINIITRSNYTGGQANAYYGQYDQGDGGITRGDVLFGLSGDRGSLTAAAEYRKEEEVLAGDREFSAYPQGPYHPTRGWSTTSEYGTLHLPTALGGNVVLNEDGDFRDLSDYHRINTDTGGATGATGGAGATTDKSNPNTLNHLRFPLESKSLFVNGIFDITDDMRLRADVLYSDRDSEVQLGGVPFVSSTANTPVIMSTDSYYNPVGTHHGFATPQAVNFSRRTDEVPRVNATNSITSRFSASLDGSFAFGERLFDWDVGYLYNRNELTQVNSGNLNLANVAQAVGPSYLNPTTGRVECGTAAAPIAYGAGAGQCVPWNPLIPLGTVADGGLTGNQELQDFLFQDLYTTGETETTLFTANLAGTLWTLPAGDLGFAVGVETRKEEGEFVPDPLTVSGGSSFLTSGPTSGSYSVDEVYAELQIPLLSEVAFARELSVNVASRYSDYDSFGDTLNSKFGFKWRPIDSLLIRGTWAEGFRAPAIADLFGGSGSTFSFFTDPCDTRFGASATDPAVRARCAEDIANADTYRQLGAGGLPVTSANAQTPIAFTQTSNTALDPETSVSKTLGLVWSPDFAEGLTLSLDWWTVRIEDTIVFDSATQMLNDCYILGIEERCSVINPGTGELNFVRDPVTGMITELTFATLNAGYRETEGFDFGLRYRFETAFGKFDFDWQSTYTSKDEILTSTNPNALPQQLVGFATVPGVGPGTFRLRSNANLGWSMGPWSVNWGARYYSSMKDNCLDARLFPEECSDPGYIAGNPLDTRPINKLGSNTFHDLEIRFRTPWKATIAIGANNVFDHIGPVVYARPNSSFTYQGAFDIGRFTYMKYQQSF